MNTSKSAFENVETRHPERLTAKQIESYNIHGYVAPLNVFSPQEAEKNRVYFDSLLDQLAGRSSYAINCYQARCRGIWELCTEPRILDLVEDIIGPNIVCWASHFFCKLPNDPKIVPWHQDASYWKLSPTRTVTVWLAIDDADEENSAMLYIPSTHRKGHLRFRRIQGAENLAIETVGANGMGQPVSNNLMAGQVSLHADMLVHGSLANDSTRRRCGLTIRYCPPIVEFTDDKWAQGVEAIVCRGKVPESHWKHHPRPRGDDVSEANSPLSVGGN